MKRISIIGFIITYGFLCFLYSFDNNNSRAYDPDSSLRRDSLYQKEGTDSVFRYLRSNGQNKFLYRIRTALYDRTGITIRQRMWADTITPVTGDAQTIDISSAGFAKVISVQAQVQTNTTVANNVPIVAVKSYSNTQVVINVVQGNTVSVNALGANVAGLRFLQTPSSSKIHLLVVGY